MASMLVVEQRGVWEDEWSAYGSFEDFDTCLGHVKEIVKDGKRVARLIVPGSFRLSPDQQAALQELGIQHNT